MQRKKLGMAVVWMVCLLGMVAVVWSRPPLGGSQQSPHPTLALANPGRVPNDPAPIQQPQPAPELKTPVVSTPQTTQPLQPAGDPSLPVGVWVREFPSRKIRVEIEGHRLRILATAHFEAANVDAQYHIAADYHITKDSILYGVITSAEIQGSETDSVEQVIEASFERLLFDQPFSLRFRQDADVLTIKDFKLGQLAEETNFAKELLPFVAGRYSLEPAKPVKPTE